MSDQCDAEFTSDIASGDNEANADLSSSLLSIGTKLKQYTKPPQQTKKVPIIPINIGRVGKSNIYSHMNLGNDRMAIMRQK